VRATVVARLTGLGYRVLEADSAAAALAQMESGAPIDLLFTDIVMPGGMSGKQLATLARKKYPKLKVLFTSGFPGSMLSGGSELEDGDRLLSKPYRKNDLARAVSEALAE
jgi:CheY-like chemotaxis protein